MILAYLSCRESTRPHWNHGFAFCQTGLELLDLLAVSFNKGVSIDHFLLLRIELVRRFQYAMPYKLLKCIRSIPERS
jgi:hypothetical protein